MLSQARADAARERDELREALQARVQAAAAELARSEREHGAELGRIQAAAEARATALEEARADLRARAERAERELDRATRRAGGGDARHLADHGVERRVAGRQTRSRGSESGPGG